MMSYEKVKQAKQLLIGTKQTKKAIDQGRAQEVVIASDADERLIAELIDLCQERGIAISYVNSMKKLGRACGIEVGAASVALIY
jgi:large subunit ribosomal protein L7A